MDQGGHHRDYYLSLRRAYQPERVMLAIVAESPPVSGLYFYDPSGSTGEPLFRAFMGLLGLRPANKDGGLRALQRLGWLLVDATYRQVDGRKPGERDHILLGDYDLLRRDLDLHAPDAALIVIKANVHRLLARRLSEDGFDVLNLDRMIPFPSTGHQNKFKPLFEELAARHLTP